MSERPADLPVQQDRDGQRSGGPLPLLVVLSLTTAAAVLGVVAYRVLLPAGPVRDDARDMSQALALRDRGLASFRAWARARREGHATEARHWRAAHDDLTAALDAVDRVLQRPEYTSPSGIRPEYEGWTEVQAEIAPYLHDLLQAAPAAATPEPSASRAAGG